MNSNLRNLIVVGLPALWAICAAAYIIFSEREKRLFLSGASILRPWLLIPPFLQAALLLWATQSGQRLFKYEALGALATIAITASPIFALLIGRLLDSEPAQARRTIPSR